MVDFQDSFAQPIAYNPDTEKLVSDAEFTVHLPDDLAFATPLSVADPVTGLPISPFRANAVGVLPDFRVAGDPPQVLLKSGSFVTKVTSVSGAVMAAGLAPAVVQEAIAARAASLASAESAGASAGAAATSAVEAIAARVGAEQARDAAEQVVAEQIAAGVPDYKGRARELEQVRRGSPRATARVALPAAFAWQDCPVPVFFDGARYFTNYDVGVQKHTGGATRIVDTRIAPNGQLGKAVAALTAPLYKGVATTTLTVSAISDALTHGMQLTVYSGASAHIFIVNGAHAAGVTTITVASSTPGVDLMPGFTVASPYGKVSDAVTAAADGDTILIINPGVVWRAKNVTSSAITKALSIIGLNKPILAVADEPTWVATSGQPNVYQYNRTSVLRIVDLGVDSTGYEYPKATSLADCNATAGTWWQDSGGAQVYVHPLRGGAPVKDQIIPLLNAAQFNFSTTGRSSASKVYLEGLTILGSTNGVKVDWNTAQPIDFYAKDCDFLWAEQLTSNALNILCRTTILQGCLTAHGGADGFNYHKGAGSGATPPRFVEIDCVGHSSGLRHIGTASDPIMNATTAHDGAIGLRIGGTYHYTFGTIVADVHNGTQSVNYSCDAFDSLAPDGHDFDSAYRVAEGTAEMWLFDCRGFGTAADLQALTGVLHATDTQFDTSGGSGTLNVLRPR